MLRDVQIYILHHAPLVERKKFFEEQLLLNNLTGIWIEDYTPETISPPTNSKITKTEYSLYLKHKHALNHQITNNLKYGLIFEDDALLGDNFQAYFDTLFTEFLQLDCDILMIGTAVFPTLSLEPQNIIPGKHVYYDPSYTTRCTHAILYNINAAQHVVNNLEANLNPYDHKLNQIILDKNLKTCWAYPGLLQGSRPDSPNTHLWGTSLR